jgi:hypothetical protein
MVWGMGDEGGDEAPRVSVVMGAGRVYVPHTPPPASPALTEHSPSPFIAVADEGHRGVSDCEVKGERLCT